MLPLNELKASLAMLEANLERSGLLENVNEELYKLITKETIQKLTANRLAAVGSHGHVHVNLNMLSPEQAKEEIVYSKACLEKFGRKPVRSLAFPYGYFNEAIIRLAKEAGYVYLQLQRLCGISTRIGNSKSL